MKNFRSFKTKQTFSMQTAPYLKKFKESNTIKSPDIRLLKNALIFGANGGGKTNVFEGIRTLRALLLNWGMNYKRNHSKLPYVPFKMDEENELGYTEFEIVLYLDFRYFKFTITYDGDRIHHESLVELKTKRDILYYEREYSHDKQGYLYKTPKVSDLTDKTRKNISYLTILSEFNDDTAILILDWFKFDLKIIDTNYDLRYFNSLLEKLEDEKFKHNVLNILKVADYNIVDIIVNRKKEEIPDIIKKILEDDDDDDEKFIEFNDAYTVYNKVNSHNGEDDVTLLHADSYESRGTKKMIVIAIALLDAFERGKTLLIDEFDSAFHIAISKFLLQLFNSKDYNKNAQFILNTHDINLLDNNILRVDQIWFAEKNKLNSTEIYSLYDFNDDKNRSRSDISYAKEYLKGKFGAYPVISEGLLDIQPFNNCKAGI
ncbi:ATP-binding protein [Virgibacillus salarius]